MKEKTLDLKKVNLFSVLFVPIFFIAAMLPYAAWTSENIKEGFSLTVFIAIMLAVIPGIIIHELIHGVCFAIFTKGGFKSLKFGVMWKYVAFYCHCSEPIKAKYYIVTLLMPSIILGFIPLIIAYSIQSFALLFFACMMICGGIGDYYCAWLLRNFNKDCMILDHPDKVGFMYGTKNQFSDVHNSETYTQFLNPRFSLIIMDCTNIHAYCPKQKQIRLQRVL